MDKARRWYLPIMAIAALGLVAMGALTSTPAESIATAVGSGDLNGLDIDSFAFPAVGIAIAAALTAIPIGFWRGRALLVAWCIVVVFLVAAAITHQPEFPSGLLVLVALLAGIDKLAAYRAGDIDLRELACGEIAFFALPLLFHYAMFSGDLAPIMIAGAGMVAALLRDRVSPRIVFGAFAMGALFCLMALLLAYPNLEWFPLENADATSMLGALGIAASIALAVVMLLSTLGSSCSAPSGFAAMATVALVTALFAQTALSLGLSICGLGTANHLFPHSVAFPLVTQTSLQDLVPFAMVGLALSASREA